MPTSLPSRSLTAVLALALSIVAIAALLVLSPQALAHGHKAACSSSATQTKHGARACAQSRRAGGSHKGKAHARPKVKGHHSKHAATTKKTGKKKAKSPTGTIQTPAVCEDGSLPIRESDGFFSCDDESEPGCENGATPMLTPNGAKLICGPAPKGAPVSPEAVCEDGSTPSQGPKGVFSCDDESEPTCENGSEPTLSSNGSTLLCNVSTTEKTPAE